MRTTIGDQLQGLYVNNLPFPGVMPEEKQREQLADLTRKYAKPINIRFDAIPKKQTSAGHSTSEPLSRRALIIIPRCIFCFLIRIIRRIQVHTSHSRAVTRILFGRGGDGRRILGLLFVLEGLKVCFDPGMRKIINNAWVPDRLGRQKNVKFRQFVCVFNAFDFLPFG